MFFIPRSDEVQIDFMAKNDIFIGLKLILVHFL